MRNTWRFGMRLLGLGDRNPVAREQFSRAEAAGQTRSDGQAMAVTFCECRKRPAACIPDEEATDTKVPASRSLALRAEEWRNRHRSDFDIAIRPFRGGFCNLAPPHLGRVSA